MMKILYGILMPCLFCFCACGDRSGERLRIAVSVEPQRYLLEQIAGDNFDIVTLMPPGSNPETFEPSMNTRIALDNAKAYFYVGGLPFESALMKSSPDLMSVCASEGIEPLYGTHSHHHHNDLHHLEEEPDPHVWTSVKNARIMAANMAEALISLDPKHGEEYSRRLSALDSRLDSLDRKLAERLDSVAGKAFMVWHPSLGYFARDYGLIQLSVGWESKEPSAAALRRAVDEARNHGVNVFFYQKEFDTRQTRVLTSQLGLRTVTIDPLNYDWPGQINLIADELLE